MCLFVEGMGVKKSLLCIMATTILYMIETEYFFYVASHTYALAFTFAIVAIGTYLITRRGYLISCSGRLIQSHTVESWMFYSLLNTTYLPIVIALYAVGYRHFKRREKEIAKNGRPNRNETPDS